MQNFFTSTCQEVGRKSRRAYTLGTHIGSDGRDGNTAEILQVESPNPEANSFFAWPAQAAAFGPFVTLPWMFDGGAVSWCLFNFDGSIGLKRNWPRLHVPGTLCDGRCFILRVGAIHSFITSVVQTTTEYVCWIVRILITIQIQIFLLRFDIFFALSELKGWNPSKRERNQSLNSRPK